MIKNKARNCRKKEIECQMKGHGQGNWEKGGRGEIKDKYGWSIYIINNEVHWDKVLLTSIYNNKSVYLIT